VFVEYDFGWSAATAIYRIEAQGYYGNMKWPKVWITKGLAKVSNGIGKTL